MNDFIKEIIDLIMSDLSNDELLNALSQYHESDIAEAFGELEDDLLLKLYDILPAEMLADIITYIEEPSRYLDLMDNEEVAEILDNMESNDALDIIEQLDSEDIDEINTLIEPETLEDIQLVGSYEEEMIGSIMSTDFIAINEDCTIKQAMKEVIKCAEDVENINNVYVVDELGKYIGIISLRDLIRARSTELLSTITKINYPTLLDTELIDDIDSDLLDYELESYPVLDENDILIGVVNDETIIEIFEDEYKEDYARLAGMSEIQDAEVPLHQSVLKRLPWLAFLLVIGLLVSLLTSSFEKIIIDLSTIVFFQSLILGMAGNTGTQSLAVTISSLNEDTKKIHKILIREIFTGFINGVIIGTLAFILVLLFLLVGESFVVAMKTALSVGVSLVVSMTIASFLGTFVPYILTKLKVDPAVASGPFITTINDIVAIVIYYGLASLLFYIF